MIDVGIEPCIPHRPPESLRETPEPFASLPVFLHEGVDVLDVLAHGAQHHAVEDLGGPEGSGLLHMIVY